MGPDAGQRPVQEPQEQSGNAALGPSFLLNQQLGLDARGQDRSEGPPSTWNPEEGFSHTHLPASTPGRHLGREARPSLRELDPFLPPGAAEPATAHSCRPRGGAARGPVATRVAGGKKGKKHKMFLIKILPLHGRESEASPAAVAATQPALKRRGPPVLGRRGEALPSTHVLTPAKAGGHRHVPQPRQCRDSGRKHTSDAGRLPLKIGEGTLSLYHMLHV